MLKSMSGISGLALLPTKCLSLFKNKHMNLCSITDLHLEPTLLRNVGHPNTGGTWWNATAVRVASYMQGVSPGQLRSYYRRENII